jgi:Cdc6-like AAA superfamily ATPase
MVTTRWTDDQLKGFHTAAQSLKLYRRADLAQAEGPLGADSSSLIEELYVDPLPNEHIFQTMMRPNTTFVVGRKGTGKSTIFQRVQHELSESPAYASAYLDIKTIFESSQVSPELLEKLDSSDVLPREILERLLLYRSFLKQVISEIRGDLATTADEKLTWWDRAQGKRVSRPRNEVLHGLGKLLEEANDDKFINILGVMRPDIKMTDSSSNQTGAQATTTASASATPSLQASIGGNRSHTTSTGEEKAYAEVLMRTFDITEFVARLKTLLDAISVKHLYVFVDDFSELPEQAMRIVVDTILAPLNNWSEELIKFKVAAYPGRIYYGNIDKTKIDEINLDLYRLYGTTDVSAMEEKAIDFTRRLVERRVMHYCGCEANVFIEAKDEDIWRLFFYATMGNPRNLGYILFFLYESHLIFDRSVGPTAIRDAARKYYEEKLESYFSMNKFLHEDFQERSSVFSLKELLEALVNRARELRRHRKSAVMRDIQGRPPTSHFHIVTDLEGLLSTLELNFFLTKYWEMSDRDGRKVSVFALNYGLCQKYTIEFGRPLGKREYRLYFVERVFDYTPILNKYMHANQEIVCDNDECGAKIGLEKLEALRLFDMKCPVCHTGTCHVVNLSKKYAAVLESIEPNLLLPRSELGILHTLRTESKPLFANEIAQEIDSSYQLVGVRSKFLADRGLVDRDKFEGRRRRFELTEMAEKSYFEEDEADELDVQ